MTVDAPQGTAEVSLADRIELRRFVGRELLLWLWFESELFDATLATREHGSFGLWPSGRLVVTDGRESTSIKGVAPGAHREAKEALLRGKTPERIGLSIAIGDAQHTLTLRGDTLAFTALSPPPAPEREAPPEAALLAPQHPKKRRPSPSAEESEAEADDTLAERMHHAREVERVVEALYRDFLAVRLSREWARSVLPAMEDWASGRDVDERAYRSARDRALAGSSRPRR